MAPMPKGACTAASFPDARRSTPKVLILKHTKGHTQVTARKTSYRREKVFISFFSVLLFNLFTVEMSFSIFKSVNWNFYSFAGYKISKHFSCIFFLFF